MVNAEGTKNYRISGKLHIRLGIKQGTLEIRFVVEGEDVGQAETEFW